jgi:hypothetical protein
MGCGWSILNGSAVGFWGLWGEGGAVSSEETYKTKERAETE